MRVSVHWNYNKRLFSVTALEGENKGRVIAHATTVVLVEEDEPVVFKVSEAGRQRVLRQNRKNVHAKVVGQLAMYEEEAGVGYRSLKHLEPAINGMSTLHSRRLVRYDPFRMETFRTDTGATVRQARVVEFHRSDNAKPGARITAWAWAS